MILRVVSPQSTIEESPYIAVDPGRRGRGGAGGGGEAGASVQPQGYRPSRNNRASTTPLLVHRANATVTPLPLVTPRVGQRPTAQQLQQLEEQRHAGEVFVVVRQNANPHLQRVSLNLGSSHKRHKRSLEQQEEDQERIKRALHPKRQQQGRNRVRALGDAASQSKGTSSQETPVSKDGSSDKSSTGTTLKTLPTSSNWRKRGLKREITKTTVEKTIGSGDNKRTTTTTTTKTRYVRDLNQKRRSALDVFGKRARLRSANNNTASTADPDPDARLEKGTRSRDFTDETQSETESSFSGQVISSDAPNTAVGRSAFSKVPLVTSVSSEQPDLEETSSTSSSSYDLSTDSEYTTSEGFRYTTGDALRYTTGEAIRFLARCPVGATLSIDEAGSLSSASQERRRKRKKNQVGDMWRRGRGRYYGSDPDDGETMDASMTAVRSTTIALNGRPIGEEAEREAAANPSRPPKVIKTMDNTINTYLMHQPGGRLKVRTLSLGSPSSLSERSPIKGPAPILRNPRGERKRRPAPTRTLSLLGRSDTKRVSFTTDTHFDQAIRAGFAALSTAGKSLASTTVRLSPKPPESRSLPPSQSGRIPAKVKPIVRRLSSSEKVSLFRQRPDLDPYAAYALWQPSRATKSFSEGIVFPTSNGGSFDASLSSTSKSQGSSSSSSGSRTSATSPQAAIVTASSTDSETDVEAEFISIKWVRRLRSLAKANAQSNESSSSKVNMKAEQRQEKYGTRRDGNVRGRHRQLSPPPPTDLSSVEPTSMVSRSLTIEGSNYDVIHKDLVPRSRGETRDPPPSSSLHDAIAPLGESILNRISCCAACHE